jgi:hypothetical protein
MRLAAGGRYRNQDKKIVLLFSARNICLRTGLATLGSAVALHCPNPLSASLNSASHGAGTIGDRHWAEADRLRGLPISGKTAPMRPVTGLP